MVEALDRGGAGPAGTAASREEAACCVGGCGTTAVVGIVLIGASRGARLAGRSHGTF